MATIAECGRHRIVCEMSPFALVQLQKAAMILAKMRPNGRLPTQGETVEWVLHGFPADQLWEEVYGVPFGISHPEAVQTDVQVVPDTNE